MRRLVACAVQSPCEVGGNPRLAHGALADGASWNGVIERLQAKQEAAA
jgi:hypothetical protein